MEKAYKFRIYPNKEQEILIQKTFGSCRFMLKYYEKMRFESDMESYEGTLENNTRAFQDILELISDFEDKIENRKMIAVKDVNKLLEQINKTINRQI